MKSIQMVDLQSQYLKIKNEIDEAVQEVMRSGLFINGPAVQEFTDALGTYLGARHVIPCANGTDALQVAMMALGLQQGDEVIIPAFTYAATAEAAMLLGLKPVLVDVDPKTFLIDIKKAGAAVTPRTRAIVPVHLFGQCADMEALMQLATGHNLYVIEDAAQAIGSDFVFRNGIKQKAGTIGHIGATSFFPSKNLGCMGDGGAMFTNDDTLAARLKMIANHGQKEKYLHEVIGVNSRLDTVQAAILKVKLRYLESYTKARQEVAAYYDKAFRDVPGLIIPARAANSSHVFHQYTLQAEGFDRDALRERLAKEGIPTMVYYPVPLHRQKAYADERYNGKLPVTESLCKSVFSLPISTEMEREQLEFIVSRVTEFCKQNQKKNG